MNDTYLIGVISINKKDIQHIYDLYIGGFINADMAMSLIGKELKKEKVQMKNVTAIVGNEEIDLGNATIIYKTLT